MDDAHKLLASLTKEIDEDIAKTVLEAKYIEALDLEYDTERERLNEVWGNHRLRVAPIKALREHTIKQLAHIEAMKTPGPIFIPKP